MEVMPAIDLLDGKVVRLAGGRREAAIIYSQEPLEIAASFIRQGAKMLHLVDLDAAFGTGGNRETIAGMAELASRAGASVEVGGGVRSLNDADELFACGAGRVIVGTKAAEPGFLQRLAARFGRKVWAACEVRGGRPSVEGWSKNSIMDVEDILQTAKYAGAGGVLVTCIDNDGLGRGISTEFFSSMRAKTGLPLIASGGVSSLEDMRSLARIGYEYAIVGKALYENAISLEDALEVAINVG